ncbi:MAG: pilus assembly protein TadG-related protein, partial [Bryobacteraceae bacterium]
MGISVFTVLGVMGLAIDLGRMYITKNEAQTFTDMTSLAAANELDGTDAGITTARNKVTSSTMQWNMSTQGFASPTVEFSLDGTNFEAAPVSGIGIQWVRVTVTLSNVG